MLTDTEMRTAVDDGLMLIEPLSDDSIQPASYDLRVGAEAFVSGGDAKIDVANRGLLVIDPGEFAVIATRERVRCGPRVAAQLGLESSYARKGLTLLSGPQIDPGFDGVLVVRVTNLAPQRISLAFEAPFLTAQFFKLAHDVAHPYNGSRQGQTGLGARDIEELTNPDSPTLGGMVKSLTSLAHDVSELSREMSGLKTEMSGLKATVNVIAWAIGVGFSVMTVVLTIVGLIAVLRH